MLDLVVLAIVFVVDNTGGWAIVRNRFRHVKAHARVSQFDAVYPISNPPSHMNRTIGQCDAMQEAHRQKFQYMSIGALTEPKPERHARAPKGINYTAAIS